MRSVIPLYSLSVLSLTAAIVASTGPTAGTPRTVGDLALDEARWASVTAFGDCPTVASHTCNDEQWRCKDKSCEGSPYNPKEACMAACVFDCALRYDLESDEYAECVTQCIEIDCAEEVNELVKDCVGPIPQNKEPIHTEPFDVKKMVAISFYSMVNSEEVMCIRFCECSPYCLNVAPPGQGQNFECSKTAECNDTDPREKATDRVVGVCPPGA